MRALGDWLRRRGWKPRQVQCFIPTPGTVATAMYHAGIDPEGNPIYVAKSDKERLLQHHILIPEHGAPEKASQKREHCASRRPELPPKRHERGKRRR